MRNKTFVSVDGATISIQDGSPPKHLHANANEIQYILEGKGTIWLGDKEVQVKPGDLVIIPKGTPHGGTKPDGRTIKAIAIKTPAAGAGRYQAAELTARLCLSSGMGDCERSEPQIHLAMHGRWIASSLRSLRNDGEMTTYPRALRRVRPPHQQPPLDQRHRRYRSG